MLTSPKILIQIRRDIGLAVNNKTNNNKPHNLINSLVQETFIPNNQPEDPIPLLEELSQTFGYEW